MKKIKLEFPKIYRRFTDKNLWWVSYPLTILFLAIFLLIFVLIGLAFLGNLERKSQLDKARQAISSQINYWKEITDQHRDYRDGYFQLAILEYRLNDTKKAREYLQTVFQLDPNFQKGRELEKLLQ